MEHQINNTRKKERFASTTTSIVLIVILAFLVYMSTYMSLPYFVTRPGSAIELQPIIDVESGKKDEKGSFMLTTVRMGEATPIWYLYAYLSPDVDLIEKELVLPHGESDEDFTKKELAVMENSQKMAEAIAFKKAGYPVRIENTGVMVMGTVPGLPAAEILDIGDVITQVDGKKVLTRQDLLDLLENKKAGETIEVTFTRKDKQMKKRVALALLPSPEGEKKRVGIGVSPETRTNIEVPKKVTIHAENIGGPSAGLMFTLEIYDQINHKIDLTRGYKVAGTGTINPDGSVGRIGGIHQKIVAADSAGAEIFFAPDDVSAAGEVSNYEEAAATAKRIQTSMRVVPVKNVDDAIHYLKSLKPKP